MNMRILFVLLGFVFMSSFCHAQSPLYAGEKQANFGLGIDDGGGTPLYAGVDFNIANNLTLGPVAAVSSDFFSGTGNLNYHFDELFVLPSEWNVYAGVNAGFIVSLDDDFDGDGFGIGAQLGGRYFFSDRLAVNLEGGGGNQLAGGKLGVTLKF